MAAVARVRRRAGGARTGHAGTLDPLAEGVLVLALGRATKVIDRLMATEKRYRTVVDLSAFTETDDLEGPRTEVEVQAKPVESDLRHCLGQFVGRFRQRPPRFSAVKIDGKRAYKMARRGETVEPAPREVTVHQIDLVGYAWPKLELAIHCAKGFYVRSLARDIGRSLGTGGHCLSIIRTAVGPFTIEDSLPLDAVPEPLTEEHLIAVDDALRMVEAGR